MSFTAFLKKEVNEIFKTSKIILLSVLFLFFGILSPLSAKYTNQLLAIFGEQQGIKIVLPDPTYIQAYQELFKNLYFMLVIIMILVFAGSVAEEKSKGTAVLVLTKCLSRTSFVLGKLIAAILLFTVSYAVSAAACMYYTYLLFPQFISSGVLTALFMFWIFGVFIISVTLLSSIAGRSFTIAAVGGFIGYVVVSALGAIPYIDKYTPGILQGLSIKIINGINPPSDAITPLVITFVLAAAAIVGGITIFKRQEL